MNVGNDESLYAYSYKEKHKIENNESQNNEAWSIGEFYTNKMHNRFTEHFTNIDRKTRSVRFVSLLNGNASPYN